MLHDFKSRRNFSSEIQKITDVKIEHVKQKDKVILGSFFYW